MKPNWRMEVIQLLPIAAMFLAGVLCWPYAPDHIPAHWNFQGQVDRYGGKFEGLLLLPLVALGLYGLLRVLPAFDPGKENYRTFLGAYDAIRLTVTLFLAAIYTVGVLTAFGYHVNMTTVVGLAMGVLFLVLGNVMGKIRPNWFVGVRTPWTLSSKLSWTKTHRLAGWLFILMGLFAIVWGIAQNVWVFGTMLAVDGVCAVTIMVYSYLVYRKDPARMSPADTRPVAE
jgi:uncharacterized membrane protein